MENSRKLMLKRIWNFISNHDDYIPIELTGRGDVVGFYNALYHDDGIFSVIHKPAKKGTKNIPLVVFGYGAMDDGSVFVVTLSMSKIKLSKCDDISVGFIYKQLIETKREA